MADGSVTIVIIGATGDLSKRKLLPALFNLHCKGRLPEHFHIVGFSRTQAPDEQFREDMWRAVQEFSELAPQRKEWERFAKSLFYVSGDLTNADHFTRLKERLDELDADQPQAHRLFYLSITPQLYEPAIVNLGASGLAREDTGWRRVVIEKPFGRDLASAVKLDKTVHSVFDESQVFRIDHYLGKETVQNLFVFRFANAIFEPIWNRTYVDNVQITVAEEVGLGDRAGYYDQSGVIRDMVQNHLLQLLTMVAMEPPNAFDADTLRNKKIDVLKAIRRWEPKETPLYALPGQYEGYREETGVPPDSRTATYAALRVYVDNWRWQNVPFYLRTGKALAGKTSEIIIQFHCPPHLMFELEPGQAVPPNILSLCLQPDEGAHLRFQAKVPDAGMQMRPVNMEFHYGQSFKSQALPEAYENLLEDALQGDASLFIRGDHIEEAWRIVEPVLESWEGPDPPPLYTYRQGSWGPKEADEFLARNGHQWLLVCGESGGGHA